MFNCQNRLERAGCQGKLTSNQYEKLEHQNKYVNKKEYFHSWKIIRNRKVY